MRNSRLFVSVFISCQITDAIELNETLKQETTYVLERRPEVAKEFFIPGQQKKRYNRNKFKNQKFRKL